ncbi:hypothetical protein AAC387_Pa05g2323 [Persea americana]
MAYLEGIATRTNVLGRVCTAKECPPAKKIPFHHGMVHLTFSTQDKTTAEQRAAQLGVKLEWMEDGVKLVAGPIEAIRTDKTRGRKVWFNNVVTHFTSGEDSHNDP